MQRKSAFHGYYVVFSPDECTNCGYNSHVECHACMRSTISANLANPANGTTAGSASAQATI